jgi:hypothetical protein
MHERRQTQRLRYTSSILLRHPGKGRSLHGVLRDISLGGAGVVTGLVKGFKQGEGVRFEIPLVMWNKRVFIRGKGKVAWVDSKSGLGLVFAQMKDDDFIRLRRLVEYNSGSVEKASRDLERLVKKSKKKPVRKIKNG